MKTRFNSYDIVCAVAELQKLIGLRVNQIYDVDNKTYLLRFQGTQTKSMLLIESGLRFHTTDFEWPKNTAPSGFSMKLRKHLKNKRLEKIQQLGTDRIVDFEFGSKEATYHIFLELYDRGNIVLTDHEYTILYLLRPHTEGEEVRFAVREKYPMDRAKQNLPVDSLTAEKLNEQLQKSPGDYLRRALVPIVDCGPSVIEHFLIKHNLNDCIVKPLEPAEGCGENAQQDGNKQKQRRKAKKANNENERHFDVVKDMPGLLEAIKQMHQMLVEAKSNVSKGFVIQKRGEVLTAEGEVEKVFYQNIEYHPFLFAQFENQPYATFDSFLMAVDEFYSKLEGQKIDLKTMQQERDAIKKLTNVKKDHAVRLEELSKNQEVDRRKAELITTNQELVDNAILAVCSLLATQMSWQEIRELIKAAQTRGDPVANSINQLKLETNKIALKLLDQTYSDVDSSDDDDDDDDDSDKEASTSNKKPKYVVVDVDLSMTAWANARSYYDQKRMAAKKEQKTIDASEKALKNAERKTQQTLKEVRTISNISKARKVYWFEKFYWFISSENYLVIGGRDAQQNELIVKRYMRPTDIYVHAEIQGASSVVIRNPTGNEVPPKTLLEAGTMAISYSVAWDAKVVTNVYWVKSDQVSKKAPTGEYLGTGSFMIRGKKNFLPSCQLVMGLSLLFKLEDSFVDKHRGERKVRTFDEEQQVQLEQQFQNQVQVEENAEEQIERETAGQQMAEKQSSNDSESESENSLSDEATKFPDTQVKIEHDTGCVTIRSDSVVEAVEAASPTNPLIVKQNNDEEEQATIIAAAPTRKKQQINAKKRREVKDRKNAENKEKSARHQAEAAMNSNNKPKRGQHGKLKKLKSKYKDQDEEERILRMKLLKSIGKNDEAEISTLNANEMNADETAAANRKSPRKETKKPENEQEDDDNVDDTLPADADLEMLDTLTGQPFEDDELLFVIPVVAPYQALQNYKYKVKLIPGTGKRGKAAKTALVMFSKDKLCTSREKDLLKSVKDDLLARNIPGKVKLTAPQLQKYKK